MDMEYDAMRALTVAKYHWQDLPETVKLAWCGGLSSLITRSGISIEVLAARWLVHPDVISYWLQVGDTWKDVSAERALLYLRGMAPISHARSSDELQGHAMVCTCWIDDSLGWMQERS